jgi:predicted signal transduction protein with EAL and GGDEF domain
MRQTILSIQVGIIAIGAWVAYFSTEGMPLLLPFAIFTTLLTLVPIVLFFKK